MGIGVVSGELGGPREAAAIEGRGLYTYWSDVTAHGSYNKLSRLFC